MTGQLGGWLRGDNDPEVETDVVPEIEILSDGCGIGLDGSCACEEASGDGLSDQETDVELDLSAEGAVYGEAVELTYDGLSDSESDDGSD